MPSMLMDTSKLRERYMIIKSDKFIWLISWFIRAEDLKKAKWYLDREIAKREGKSE